MRQFHIYLKIFHAKYFYAHVLFLLHDHFITVPLLAALFD